jgi:hypothetical protein
MKSPELETQGRKGKTIPMNESNLPFRPTLSKRIELYRLPSGELAVWCERCDKINLSGVAWCCAWARLMVHAHIFGRLRRAA